MRVKSLLGKKNRLLGKLDKTTWVEMAISLVLAVCFLFFIKPRVNSAVEPLIVSLMLV